MKQIKNIEKWLLGKKLDKNMIQIYYEYTIIILDK